VVTADGPPDPPRIGWMGRTMRTGGWWRAGFGPNNYQGIKLKTSTPESRARAVASMNRAQRRKHAARAANKRRLFPEPTK